MNKANKPTSILLLVILFLTFNVNAMAKENIKTAIFAGGCFWCMEPVFDVIDGVLETTVGYSGGKEEDANYQSISTGRTAHLEVIKVKYDEAKVKYEKLLEQFMLNIDPLDPIGQFADKGPQYVSAIYYNNEAQKKLIESYVEKVEKSGILKGEIVTKILPSQEFFAAEEYHQDYYKKNPIRYNAYSVGSGRKNGVKEIWKNKDKISD